MRFLAALVFVAMVLGTMIWLARIALGPEERALPPSDAEARRRLDLAIRQLDRALADPMARLSTEWEDETRRLVNAHYGRELKQ